MSEGSESSFKTQESKILDLSDHNLRQRHTLHSFTLGTDNNRASFRRYTTSLLLNYEAEEDDDMTDEEEEISLIKPLIDAHFQHTRPVEAMPALTSSENPLRPQQVRRQILNSAPYTTHKSKLSQNITILDEPKPPTPVFASQRLTMSQFDLQQAQNYEKRNRLRQEALGRPQKSENSTKVLEKLCKWSTYSRPRNSGAIPENDKPVRRGYSIKRLNSLTRRKDFSTRAEVASLSQSGNFVFHRGFSLRRSRLGSTAAKFKNRNELTTALNYINPESMSSSELTSATRFLVMQLKKPSFWQILRLHPKFVLRSLAAEPRQTSAQLNSQRKATMQHKNSIRRKRPRVTTIRRVKSCSVPYSRSASYLQNKPLYDMWNRYLSNVISQRIEFRLYFNASASITSSLKGTSQTSRSTSLPTPSDEAYFPSLSSSLGDTDDENSSHLDNRARNSTSLKFENDVASISTAERERSSLQLQKAY
ncbi:LAME_0D06392g1_1 [Lachancea meyersii CBS 8951]|uniref:LAME_0D06392g1_1 n=1 Tax=Lachancea meyersii CBS 8951 TaxID=1266667 RepID=A0A1G4J9S0_9SACH|nr:LAME_0D06392g1_1 [Lachancea meyersii CBS 8951]